MIADGIYEDLGQLISNWNVLMERLYEGGHNMELSRSTLRGLSTKGLDSRIRLANDLLNSIRPADDDATAAVLLAARQQEVRVAIQGAYGVIQQAAATLNGQWRPSSRISDGNDTYLLALDEAGAVFARVDLSDFMRQANDFTAALVGLACQIVPMCKTVGVADLTAHGDAMARKLGEVQTLNARTADTGRQADAALQRVSEVEAEIRQVNQQGAEQLARIRELGTQASTDSGQITALTEQVRVTSAKAETLGQIVGQYQAKFDTFQQSLDERNEEFGDFTKAAGTAKAENEAREVTISRLIKQSDDMLAGSTTAGLGVALEEARKRYEKRMVSARNGFYVAVTLLLVSALPLAAHLVPNLFGALIPALDAKADGSPFAVIGKVLLLLPATWLTAFFTQTYANLFQLEREYAHKAALAGCVHGFKLQAPKYEEEITAEVFMEIRTNPAHGPAVQAASHPLYDVLAKVVGKVLDKKKDEGAK